MNFQSEELKTQKRLLNHIYKKLQQMQNFMRDCKHNASDSADVLLG